MGGKRSQGLVRRTRTLVILIFLGLPDYAIPYILIPSNTTISDNNSLSSYKSRESSVRSKRSPQLGGIGGGGLGPVSNGNPSSGALGIPQAAGPSGLANVGSSSLANLPAAGQSGLANLPNPLTAVPVLGNSLNSSTTLAKNQVGAPNLDTGLNGLSNTTGGLTSAVTSEVDHKVVGSLTNTITGLGSTVDGATGSAVGVSKVTSGLSTVVNSTTGGLTSLTTKQGNTTTTHKGGQGLASVPLITTHQPPTPQKYHRYKHIRGEGSQSSETHTNGRNGDSEACALRKFFEIMEFYDQKGYLPTCLRGPVGDSAKMFKINLNYVKWKKSKSSPQKNHPPFFDDGIA